MTDLGDRQLAFWKTVLLGGTPFVYVIRGEGHPAIKVGTAKNVKARVASLQTGNPLHLKLLFVIPGGHELERDLHRQLGPSSAPGGWEWFDGPEVSGFLTLMQRVSDSAIGYQKKHGFPPRLPPFSNLEVAPDMACAEPTVHVRRGTGRRRGRSWRMSQPEETPMTVRFIESTPVDQEAHKREALKP